MTHTEGSGPGVVVVPDWLYITAAMHTGGDQVRWRPASWDDERAAEVLPTRGWVFLVPHARSIEDRRAVLAFVLDHNLLAIRDTDVLEYLLAEARWCAEIQRKEWMFARPLPWER